MLFQILGLSIVEYDKLYDYNCWITRHRRGSDFEFIEDLYFIPSNCIVIAIIVQLVGINYELYVYKLNLLKTFLLNVPQETKETKKIPSENDRSLLQPIMSDLECDWNILFEVTNEHKISAES